MRSGDRSSPWWDGWRSERCPARSARATGSGSAGSRGGRSARRSTGRGSPDRCSHRGSGTSSRTGGGSGSPAGALRTTISRRCAGRSGSVCSGRLPSVTIEALLLDIDGVLAVSWQPLPGAVETIGRFREDGPPFRLVTNTTTKTRADLGGTLRDAGFDFADDEIITAVVATAGYLRAAHQGKKAFVLSDGD